MSVMRFRCSGRINKPLPTALVSALPAIKTNAADLQTYARKLNEGKPDEEATNKVIWGNETNYIWFEIDLAIPLPLPQVLQNKLPAIKDKIRQLKTYAVNTGMAAFHGKYHVCRHDEGPGHPQCETGQEI